MEKNLVPRDHWIVVILLLTLPTAVAGSDAQPGPEADDPRIREDGAACWERVGNGTGTTCTVLYGHIYDLLNVVLLNTQRPPDDAGDLARGMAGTPGFEPVWDLNQMSMRPIAGEASESIHRTHWESGIAGNISLDPDQPIFGYWYMSADATEAHDQDPSPDAGVLPCLTVRMRLFDGRWVGDGPPVSEGTLTKTVVNAPGVTEPGIPAHDCTGRRETPAEVGDVIEFAIEMSPATANLTRESGFTGHVEWWNHAPGDPDDMDKVYTQHWNVHTGPEHAPRFVLPMENGLEVRHVETKVENGTVDVTAQILSPWGNYDIDEESVRLTVVDPYGGVFAELDASTLRVPDAFDGAFLPLNASFLWDGIADAEPGSYTLRVVAKDLQGREATEAIIFTWSAVLKESAAPGALLAAALTVAALAVKRRMRRA